MITFLLALIVIILLFGASAVLGALGQILLLIGITAYFIYFGWMGLFYIIGGFGIFYCLALVFDKTIGPGKYLEASIKETNQQMKDLNQAIQARQQEGKNIYESHESLIANKPLSDDATQKSHGPEKDQCDSIADFPSNKTTEKKASASDYIECPSCNGYILKSSSFCKHCKTPFQKV